MENYTEKIFINCIFCKSTYFVLPDTNFKPYHGVLLVCANCGRENDYTSLYQIYKTKLIKKVTEDAKMAIKKEFGRKITNLKFKV